MGFVNWCESGIFPTEIGIEIWKGAGWPINNDVG